MTVGLRGAAGLAQRWRPAERRGRERRRGTGSCENAEKTPAIYLPID